MTCEPSRLTWSNASLFEYTVYQVKPAGYYSGNPVAVIHSRQHLYEYTSVFAAESDLHCDRKIYK